MPRVEALLDSLRQRLDVWGSVARRTASSGAAAQTFGGTCRHIGPSFLRTRIESETRRLGSLGPRLAPALSRGVGQDRTVLKR